MTPTYYKLTDSLGQTFAGTQWGEGVTHTAKGPGWQFCSDDLIHFYDDPLVAVFLNPVHAYFTDPRMWEAAAEGEVVSNHGLKYGAKTVTTLREVPCPKVTAEMRVRFAILCALEVCKQHPCPLWEAWAHKWLSGEDRTEAAASTVSDVGGVEGGRMRFLGSAQVQLRAAVLARHLAARAASRAAVRVSGAACAVSCAESLKLGDIDLITLAHQAYTSELDSHNEGDTDGA